MPDTAAAVDAFRKLFGPGVDLLGAIEGAEVYRDPEAFNRAWRAAGEAQSEDLRAAFADARAQSRHFPGQKARLNGPRGTIRLT